MARILRFLVTGAITTAIAYVTFVGLIAAGVHYQIANVCSWSSGVVVGFFLNRRFTFQIVRGGSHRRDFSLYVLGAVLQLILGTLGYALLIGYLHLNPTLAFLLNLTVTASFSFTFMRFVAFRWAVEA